MFQTYDQRQSNFMSLSEIKSGNVTFGNDAPGKIKGKGMVSLSNGKGKAQDVLFVDGMKYNLLSVSQVCDRGCKVVFTSKDCKIQSVNSGKLIAKGIRRKRRMLSPNIGSLPLNWGILY
jgi:hypothetical protein